jgi:hypothetical protein
MYTCNVILGIDFTASNEWKGRKSFNQQSLHKIVGNKPFNPYQKVISHLSVAMAKIMSSGISGGGGSIMGGSKSQEAQSSFNLGSGSMDVKIYAYGFGDSSTKDKSVFSLVDQSSQHKHIVIDQSDEDNFFESFDHVLLK